MVNLVAFHRIAACILIERQRQESKWKPPVGRTCADPEMPTLEKLAVLSEEFGEVARLANDIYFGNGDVEAMMDPLRVELVQVAAVAAAWVESLDATTKGA